MRCFMEVNTRVSPGVERSPKLDFQESSLGITVDFSNFGTNFA